MQVTNRTEMRLLLPEKWRDCEQKVESIQGWPVWAECAECWAHLGRAAHDITSEKTSLDTWSPGAPASGATWRTSSTSSGRATPSRSGCGWTTRSTTWTRGEWRLQFFIQRLSITFVTVTHLFLACSVIYCLNLIVVCVIMQTFHLPQRFCFSINNSHTRKSPNKLNLFYCTHLLEAKGLSTDWFNYLVKVTWECLSSKHKSRLTAVYFLYLVGLV